MDNHLSCVCCSSCFAHADAEGGRCSAGAASRGRQLSHDGPVHRAGELTARRPPLMPPPAPRPAPRTPARAPAAPPARVQSSQFLSNGGTPPQGAWPQGRSSAARRPGRRQTAPVRRCRGGATWPPPVHAPQGSWAHGRRRTRLCEVDGWLRPRACRRGMAQDATHAPISFLLKPSCAQSVTTSCGQPVTEEQP
jgi:hypothetical protein